MGKNLETNLKFNTTPKKEVALSFQFSNCITDKLFVVFHRVDKIPKQQNISTVLEGIDLANGLHTYLCHRDLQENKNLKGHIMRQSLIKVWNTMWKIINPTISPLGSLLNAFHVGDNYGKENVITYANMVRPDLMNRLHTQ